MHTSAFIFIALSSRAVLKGVEKVTLQATDTFFLLSVASYDGAARRVCPRVPSLHFDPSRQAIRCGGDTMLATYKLFMTSQPLLGWPHPNSESDKKIRARYFLPLYDPYKWIPKGILILTTRRPLPRLNFFGFFAPHFGL